MVLAISNAILNKESLEKLRASLPSIQSALATIFSLGVIASILFVGCFRLDENRQYVLRDPAEAFLFMESVNSFLSFLG